MPLPPGTRFGPYEVVSPLGAGGMGEVYRARDSRLKRDVAIKVLLPEVADDADRLARFEREAEALASLNHPNVGAIYAVEGVALVLELVDGPTLADRIAQGPLSADEALAVARQLIDALEYAHEKGVVHRDLKPANIKLTPDGVVKVLDFGLAKALTGEVAAGDPKSSPTLTMRTTMAGTIMGTAAYMAPEQARGQSVDKRADIWSFGVILHEMLAGRPLFDAPTVSDTLALVLTRTPDLAAVPAQFRPLLARCLERDARRRLRDIGDARMLLEPAPASEPQPARTSFSWTLAAAAAVATVAAAGLAFVHFREPVPPAPAAMKFEIAMPDKVVLNDGVAVSPDGRQVAFLATAAGQGKTIWIRPLDSLTARPLEGARWANPMIAWSPDSRKLLFTVMASARSVDVSSGAVRSMCEGCTEMRSAVAWTPDGSVVVSAAGGVVRIPEGGGPPTTLLPLPVGRSRVYFLRDGKHFLYSRTTTGVGASQIYAGAVGDAARAAETTPPLTSVAGGLYVYTESAEQAYLLFLRDGALYAQRFDPGSLQLKGDALPVAEHVTYFDAGGDVLAYRAGSGEAAYRLVWRDRQGRETGQFGPAGRYVNIQLAADGKSVAVDRPDIGGAYHVWTGDVARGVFARLTNSQNPELTPAIAPDGRIAFCAASVNQNEIYVASADGEGPPRLIAKSANSKHPNHISPDGRYLVYDEHNGADRQDLWIVPLDGSGKPVPFLATAADESHGQFSPDSKWIAYASDESGRQEVYVRPFAPDRNPAAGPGKYLVSTAGGDKPRWRRDGKEIFYLAPDGKMMAVPVKTSPAFEPGLPVPLFETRSAGFMPYDVTADGKFLINTPVEGGIDMAAGLTVVLNWTSLLKK